MTPFDWSMLFLFGGLIICVLLGCLCLYLYIKYRKEEISTTFVILIIFCLISGCWCVRAALGRIDDQNVVGEKQ